MYIARRMKIYVVLVVAMAALSASAVVKDYCDVDCGGKKNIHTICIFKGPNKDNCADRGDSKIGPGKLVTAPPFSKADKDHIVKRHNELRQEVAKGVPPCQPAALDMNMLKWNDELATIAERWATQCDKSGHDKCRNTLDGSWVTQNIWAVAPTKEVVLNLDDSINAWYAEHVDFPPANIKSYKRASAEKSAGHYTAMIWATTKEVGCARVFFGGGTTTIICNYKPGGNIHREPVYKMAEDVDFSACMIGKTSNAGSGRLSKIGLVSLSLLVAIKQCISL